MERKDLPFCRTIILTTSFPFSLLTLHMMAGQGGGRQEKEDANVKERCSADGSRVLNYVCLLAACWQWE